MGECQPKKNAQIGPGRRPPLIGGKLIWAADWQWIESSGKETRSICSFLSNLRVAVGVGTAPSLTPVMLNLIFFGLKIIIDVEQVITSQ